MEKIVLVDENDLIIGAEEKLEVHKKGILHRAFSIMIFNSKNEILIQKRALNKYHSPGLWSNACCSHQRENEELQEAIHRRLKEEVGFDTGLEEALTFTYNITFQNGLVENEIDHVFAGRFDGKPILNPEEVAELKWIGLDVLKADIKKHPNKYSYWFKIIMEKLKL